jgi:hypothetical protein
MQTHLQALNEKLVSVMAKQEESDLKFGTVQRSLQNMQDFRGRSANDQTGPNLNLIELETEVKFLRNSIHEEKAKREQT